MHVQRTMCQLLIAVLVLFSSSGSIMAQSKQATVGFSEAELDQMLAPIALYPDSVLTHVLIAATYPLEVVQATRWLEQNPGLSGEAAVEAASSQDWDPSVQAITAFPQLLKRLNEDLLWTQQLGEAFISDETELLASIQRLRQRAYAHGSLNKMEHVVVEREREVILIEPARREVVYVPYYDTRVVYGHWHWPAYPPIYWYEPLGYRNNVTFYWGTGFQIRPSFYFSVFDWHRYHVVVHHHYYHKPPRYYPRRQHFQYAERWQHDHYHRRGVHYRHRQLPERHEVYHSRPEQRRTATTRASQPQWQHEQSVSTRNTSAPAYTEQTDRRHSRPTPAREPVESQQPRRAQQQELNTPRRPQQDRQLQQYTAEQRRQAFSERRQEATNRQVERSETLTNQRSGSADANVPTRERSSDSVRRQFSEQRSRPAAPSQHEQIERRLPSEQRIPRGAEARSARVEQRQQSLLH